MQHHSALVAVLKNLVEPAIFHLGDYDVSLRPVFVSAGQNGQRKVVGRSLLEVTDVFCCLYFNILDPNNFSAQTDFNKTGPNPAGYYRFGSFAYLDFGVVKINNVPSLLVINAQPRKEFWKLTPHTRNAVKAWYEQSLNYLSAAAKASGLEQLAIPSNSLVNVTLTNEFGESHTAPDRILDQYYDGFSRNRHLNFTEAQIKHPLKPYSLNGTIWTKQL